MENNETFKFHGILIVLFSILFILTVSINLDNVNAANYTVDTNGNDSNNGTALNPFKSLGHALDEINPGDTIIINNGVYSSANGNNVTNLNISKNVNIYSARYLGRSTQDTILDGGNVARFFTIANGVTANIYGIKFQNGKSTSGGAIYSNGGTCKLNNVSFTNCQSNDMISSSGGAIGAVNSSGWSFVNVNFINCSIISLTGDGGAINSVNSSGWSFSNVNFINCSSGALSSGGAISAVNSIGWSFVNVVFNNCSSSIDGSAIHFDGGNFNAIYCEFINNRALGGAVYIKSGNCDISYSLFVNNYGSNNTSIQIWNSGNGTVIANNNWWGTNTPLVINATLKTWYVIIFNTTSQNIIGEKLKFTYNLLLYSNGSFKKDPNVSKLPYFAVTLRYNGVAFSTLDGRKSYSDIWSPIVKSAKPNNLTAYYGNFLLTNASFTGKIKTTLIPASTKLKGKYGDTLTIKVTLLDGKGKKLTKKIVGIYINDKLVGAVKTNSKGVATFKHKINKTGNLKVNFLHIGDDNYAAAVGKSSLAVKKHSKVLITNAVKKSGRTSKMVSTIRNRGPDKLTGKVTYRLAKGLKAVKISKKLGKYNYNKKKGVITFNLSKLAQSSSKLAKLTVTFNRAVYGKKYLTNKVTSKNTLSVSTKYK